jgi:hypothetical protein
MKWVIFLIFVLGLVYSSALSYTADGTPGGGYVLLTPENPLRFSCYVKSNHGYPGPNYPSWKTEIIFIDSKPICQFQYILGRDQSIESNGWTLHVDSIP